jgi:urease accessory protein
MPRAEQGIALSVLVAGVLLAAAVRLPVTLGMVVTGVFALCHGHAHGIAMSAYAPAGSFAAGFVLATIVLHASGIALATALQRDPALRGSPALQMLGLVLVVAGLGLVST